MLMSDEREALTPFVVRLGSGSGPVGWRQVLIALGTGLRTAERSPVVHSAAGLGSCWPSAGLGCRRCPPL